MMNYFLAETLQLPALAFGVLTSTSSTATRLSRLLRRKVFQVKTPLKRRKILKGE